MTSSFGMAGYGAVIGRLTVERSLFLPARVLVTDFRPTDLL